MLCSQSMLMLCSQSMLMKPVFKGLPLICAVLAFWATAVEAQIPSIQEQLALAEAKWSTNKPKTYEFTLEIICFCAPAPPGSEPIVFHVNNGAGSRAGSLRTRSPE